MRMGRATKKRKSSNSQKSKSKIKKAQTQNPNPPKFSSPTLVVGQISSNVIQSILAPVLTELAVKSVEGYADRALEDALLGEKMNQEKKKVVDDDGEEDEGEEEEVELDLDGNTVTSSSNSHPPQPPTLSNTSNIPSLLFTTQNDIDEFTSLLTDTSSHFTTSTNTWKVHANAAKFERLLDEKYGRFRPFIESHPQIEIVFKNIQRKYAMGGFSPLKDKLPVNKTTAIMVMMMMHRNNVRLDALILMAVFCLVGLQPWALVTLVAVGRWEMERRKGRRVNGMPNKMQPCEPYYARDEEEEEDAGAAVVFEKSSPEISSSEKAERAKKYAFLSSPVGTKYNPADLSLRDESYDVLLLGSGAETLYAAALLARAGRKVCVLSPMEDVSECVVIEEKKKNNSGPSLFANVPFDVKATNISHLSKQQHLLAPALSTTTDTQGGIRFARIGSHNDGYAHSILSVPGMGTDNTSNESMIPLVLNANGPMALADYCATCLGDGFPGSTTDLDGNKNSNEMDNIGNSTSLGYLQACTQINSSSGDYYLSKLFPATSKSDASNVYQQATIRPASNFLDKCLPLNPHIRSLMAAIGNPNENLSPNQTSMAAHVSHLCAMTSTEGMAYPVGGPRALCHALASVIEQCDGRVVTGVSLQELLFEKQEEEKENKPLKKKQEEEKDNKDPDNGPKPRCRGIRLQNGCEITVSDGEGSVISTLGFLPTFLHLLPPDVRTAHGVLPGLPAVAERRPLMKILVGLRGTKEELDLTGADWYRLPNATLPRDELDPLTGGVKFGNIGVDDDDVEGSGGGEAEMVEMTEIAEGGGGRGKRSKATTSTSSSSATTTATKAPRRSKFTSGQSWMKVSFPSAKDPSWSDRHGSVSTCVVTIEADDDYVKMFDTKPKIYSIFNKGSGSAMMGDGTAGRLTDRVLKDLMETFPQLGDKIECIQLCGPFRSGLTQNPARFAIKGNRPETPYPGLFIGGADLTVADSFSGAIVGSWLAANAVMGYSYVDHLYLKKNITSDLEQFLEESYDVEEDLAVPFDSKECDDVMMKKNNEDGIAPTTTAESSKEE